MLEEPEARIELEYLLPNMRFHQKMTNWLETHWVTPAYSGWLLTGLAIFFFGAATNTMAGWLYVISGVLFAILVIAIVLPERSLRQIRVSRRPIYPVSAGDALTIEMVIENLTDQPKTLLQVQDLLPYVLAQPKQVAIEQIPARGSYQWVYEEGVERRGVYRWQTVQLRTATPLGLFWCRRSQVVKATAIVYPKVLPLTQCPLVDEMGQDVNASVQSDQRTQGATEGVTRTLRPYRWGDPTRLVHWRTSARYGELRIRELEIFTGGQEIIICLDSANGWQTEAFEQAVMAAASLYFYALKRKLQVSLWTAATGLLRGDRVVLEALAATHAGEQAKASYLPEMPLVWLTQNPDSITTLPAGSRWLLWTDSEGRPPLSEKSAGLVVQPSENLQLQLQSSVRVAIG